MTNNEAIEILKGAIKKPNTKDGYLGQALDMAIKALKQEPCEDCVSRQAVLDKAKYWIAIKETETGTIEKRGYFVLDDDIKDLPSVTPQQKTGKWIPIKTRPLTAEEREELGTDVAYTYDCPLPEDGEEVLITNHFGETTMDIFYRDSDGCYFETFCGEDEVLAWMPFPEPYKAESEDKE